MLNKRLLKDILKGIYDKDYKASADDIINMWQEKLGSGLSEQLKSHYYSIRITYIKKGWEKYLYRLELR